MYYDVSIYSLFRDSFSDDFYLLLMKKAISKRYLSAISRGYFNKSNGIGLSHTGETNVILLQDILLMKLNHYCTLSNLKQRRRRKKYFPLFTTIITNVEFTRSLSYFDLHIRCHTFFPLAGLPGIDEGIDELYLCIFQFEFSHEMW